MKQIILPTILEFTRLVIDSFMKENSLAQKGNQVPNTEGQPKNLKFSQSLTTRQTDRHTHTHTHTHTYTHTHKHTHTQPSQKNIFLGGGQYMPWKRRIQIQTTQNLLVQGTKSEKLQKLQSESFYFFAGDAYLLFFIQGVFKTYLKKVTPTCSANFHPKT